MIGYVFKRYELKYLLTEEQYHVLFPAISGILRPDAYGETTIQSLYFDTKDDRLIRASLEKPVFKEKLRLRRYGLCEENDTVFLEMKRKYDGVVYKRRITLKEDDVGRILAGDCIPDSQIGREIGYFIAFYRPLLPKVLILCERSAWIAPASDLRVTFDRNIRFRSDAPYSRTLPDGIPLLPTGTVLMECKSGTAFPLWLTRLLCGEGVARTSFSKYGAAYEALHRRQFKYLDK